MLVEIVRGEKQHKKTITYTDIQVPKSLKRKRLEKHASDSSSGDEEPPENKFTMWQQHFHFECGFRTWAELDTMIVHY